MCEYVMISNVFFMIEKLILLNLFCILVVFLYTANVLGLCDVGAFKTQIFNLVQKFIRITKV